MIAEPAPKVAHPARYLAPVPDAEEGDDLGFLLPAGVMVLIILGTGGGGVAHVGQELFGAGAFIPVWIAFDLTVLAMIATAYVLTSRHGLRFLNSQKDLKILAAQGNTAWRCLPESQRREAQERLRAMNAACRLLLVDKEDAEARAVLERNAQDLHAQALAATDISTPAAAEHTGHATGT